MAENKIQEVIEQLENDPNHSEQMEKLLVILKEKQQTLDDNATDEEVEQAIQECIMTHLTHTYGIPDTNADMTDIDRKYMQDSIATVEEFFQEEDWNYSQRMSREDIVIYELGFNIQNCSLRIRLHIEANPRVCRIDAILPITADSIYDYILCREMANQNYPRRYGALQYDERDGEVSYRYSYPTTHGLHKDDLKHIFLAVASSAADSYDIVRKCCVGKFKPKQVHEILKKVRILVDDLNDE